MCIKNIFTIVLLILPVSTATAADTFHLESANNKSLVRFELDNDIIWNDDSNFTNGWSLQYHSKQYSSWDSSDAFALYKWVGNTLPGLNPEGSVVRYGHSIGQNMITPGDISNPHPPENDLPYAGTISYSANWQRFNEDNATIFQVTLGILGEPSLAEQFQKFVHNDLDLSGPPNGWDTQRADEPVFNLGYQYSQKIVAFGSYDNAWAGQFEISPAVSLGNIYTAADLEIGFRFGWNMPKGFAVTAAPPVAGFFHSMEIIKAETASAHSIDFYIGGHGTALLYSVFYDGSLLTSDDRDVARDDFMAAALASITYRYHNKFALRLFLQGTTHLLDEDKLPAPLPGQDSTSADLSFGAISFEYYF